MENYREKIKKLLALAGSPNENEARLALLRARELMAKYKIAEADIAASAPVPTLKKGWTGITCNNGADRWIKELAKLIAPHYCCRMWLSPINPGRCYTYKVCFCGLEADYDICKVAFAYAVNFALESCPYSTAQGKIGYFQGFISGLRDHYDEQDRAHQEAGPDDKSGWGLIMQTPEVVNRCVSSFTVTRRVRLAPQEGDDGARAYGYTAGKSFDPARRRIEA